MADKTGISWTECAEHPAVKERDKLRRLLEEALRSGSECDPDDSHRGVRLQIAEEAGL